MSGKRENKASAPRRKSSGGLAGWRRQHRAWVAGLDRGQKIRYRLFPLLVVLAILAIMICLAVRAWVRLPEIPNLPTGTTTTEDGGLDFDGAQLPSVAQSGRKDGVYTFLLVGQDTGGGGNTDTMMLITFNSVSKELYGMSLPRDTMINVSTSSKRLNAVYNYNKGSDSSTQVEKGITALKREVGKLTGIIPDFYVMIQWEAVGQLVDALGGVWFEVPFDMDYDDPAQDLHIHLKAGYQELNGEDAMGLIRWRHNNDYSVQYPTGDLGRVETQQAFLKAVAAECLKPEILLKAPSLAQIFIEHVNTDLSLGNLLAFAQLAAGMDAENGVNFVTMPNQNAQYPGVSMVLPVVDELVEVLNAGFNPYQDQIQSSDLQVLYRNRDGSYGVTSGTLLDSSLARPRSGSSSSSSGGSSGGSGETVEEPVTEEPVEDPSGSQTTDPGGELGEGEPSDGSQTTRPGEGEIGTPDSSQGQGADASGSDNQTDPSGSQGETQTDPGGSQDETQTDPGGSQGGTQTDSGGGQSGTQTDPSSSQSGSGEAAPPSQDISGGGDGLTVTDLPDWLNPTGAEPAA